MTLVIALLAAMALFDGAAAAEPTDGCDVPQTLLATDADLPRVLADLKDHHQLDISVIGTGSSALPGPNGAHFAYPARLKDVLGQRLPGNEIKVTTHVETRETSADMVEGLKKILAQDKPALVIWQTGTADAISGVEPEDFRTQLETGVLTIEAAGADVILMNMQYSPHTESMLDVSNYADIMHYVAQQHGAVLFDRLGIMRYWNDQGIFDLYAATKDYDMARRVHDCIGRGLASQIIDAAHLDATRLQTTR